MGIFLIHVKFSMAYEYAAKQLDGIWDAAGPETVLLPGSGDAAHFLAHHYKTAGSLERQLKDFLSDDLVSDYSIVEIGARCLEHEASPALEENDEDEDDEYPSVRDWIWRHGPAFPAEERLHRRGLLLNWEEEMRHDAKPVATVRKLLGINHCPHWHGRNSIFLTFWADSMVMTSLTSGKLARALEHSSFSACTSFDLMTDFVTKHGSISTLASWFRSSPNFDDGLRVDSRAARRHGGSPVNKQPRRPVIVERRSSRLVRSKD